MTDNRLGKVDIISSIQMKQNQIFEKKKVDDFLDDGWSDYSDEEDHDKQNNCIDKKAIVKVENKVKQHSNLKGYLGDDSNQTDSKNVIGTYNNKNKKKHQGGTFYNENRGDKKDYSRPVFTNSNKNHADKNYQFNHDNNTEFDNIRNNNQDYSKRRPYNNEKKHYTNRNYNRDGVSGRHYNTNQNDEKENVMKTINNFSNAIKTANEENKKIKAPLKDYLDVEVPKDRYKKDKNENRDNNDCQRPTFVNSNLEQKGNNFRELDINGDLYLKKLQEKNIDNLVEYNHKIEENKKDRGHKKRETENHVNNENVKDNDEEMVNNENELKANNNSGHFDTKFDGYKKNKKNGYQKYTDEDLWKIATSSYNQQDDHNENNEENDVNYNTVSFSGDKNHKSKKTKKNENNGNYEEKEKFEKKNEINSGYKDKVVVNLGNAKSIKDIFG